MLNLKSSPMLCTDQRECTWTGPHKAAILNGLQRLSACRQPIPPTDHMSMLFTLACPFRSICRQITTPAYLAIRCIARITGGLLGQPLIYHRDPNQCARTNVPNQCAPSPTQPSASRMMNIYISFLITLARPSQPHQPRISCAQTP